MKITVFTSNQRRHNYLINILHNLSSELFVIQEVDTLFPGLNSGRYPEGIEFQKYFKNVQNAEKKIFNIKNLNFKKKTHLLTMSKGDLNKIPFKNLSKFLKSDYYIVSQSLPKSFAFPMSPISQNINFYNLRHLIYYSFLL